MEDSLFNQRPKQPAKAVKVYTISGVTELIKTALENNLPPRLTITGQISGLKRHSSGHCYFDLKDEGAVLPAVMWKSKFSKLKFAPQNGMSVIAAGHIDVYPPHGRYQFMADSLLPEGIGDLQLAFEQMKERLRSEGLFDDARKKPLPRYPFRVGVLTSKSGAAFGDIADSIHNRWPAGEIIFYPVPVQGKGASAKIAKAIGDVNRRNSSLKLDVIILGRGGGSMEDLWAFNEEPVARAIFASKIPVISAVGHEVDFTIADFVADARASTPTKAGVLAVPDVREVLEFLDNIAVRLRRDTELQLRLADEKLKTVLAASAFRNPEMMVFNRAQQLDAAGGRLAGAAKSVIGDLRQQLHGCFEQIARISPAVMLADCRSQLDGFSAKLEHLLLSRISSSRLELEKCASSFAACNPKSVLNRGYSITRNSSTGRVVSSADDVKIGDVLISEFKQENLIESKVIKK